LQAMVALISTAKHCQHRAAPQGKLSFQGVLDFAFNAQPGTRRALLALCMCGRLNSSLATTSNCKIHTVTACMHCSPG
jgi:hypothetical protein